MANPKIGESLDIGGRFGTVRYIGPLDGVDKNKTFIGLELTSETGKNDGSVKGKRYFTCAPGYGLFIPLERLTKPAALSPTLSVHRVPEKPVAMNRAAALRIEHGSVAGSDVTGFSMMSKTSVAPAVRQAERTNQKAYTAELETKFKTITGQLFEEQEKVAALSARIVELEGSKGDKTIDEDQEFVMEELRCANKALEEKVVHLESLLANKQEQHPKVTEVDSHKEEVNKLSLEVQELKAKNALISDELLKKENELHQLSTNITANSSESAKLTGELSTTSKLVEDLKIQLETANNALKVASEEAKDKFKKLEDSLNECQQLRSNLDEIKTQIKEKDDANQKLTGDLKSVSESQSQTLKNLEQMTNERDTAMKSIEQKGLEMKKLQEEFSKGGDTNQLLISQKDEEIKRLSEVVSTKEKSLEEFKTEATKKEQSLNTELEEVRRDLKSEIDNLSSLKTVIDEKEAQIMSLKSEISKTAENSKSVLQEKESAIQQLSEEIKTLSGSQSQTLKNLEQVTNERDTAIKSVEQKGLEMKKLQEEFSKGGDANQLLISQKDEEIKRLSETLGLTEKSLTDLKSEISTKEKSLEEFKTEATKKEQSLNTELEEVRRDLKSEIDNLSSLKNVIDEKEAQIMSLNESQSRTLKDLERMTNERDTAMKFVEQKESEMKKLLEDLSKGGSANEELVSEISKKSEEIKQLSDRLTTSERAALEQKENLTKENNALSEKIEKLNRELEGTKSTLNENQETVQKLTKEIQLGNDSIAKTKEDLEKVTKERDETLKLVQSKEAEMKKFLDEITKNGSTNQELVSELSKKSEEIEQLSKSLSASEQAAAEQRTLWTNEKNALSIKIEEISKQLDAENKLKTNLTSTVEEKENMILSLKSQLSEEISKKDSAIQKLTEDLKNANESQSQVLKNLEQITNERDKAVKSLEQKELEMKKVQEEVSKGGNTNQLLISQKDEEIKRLSETLGLTEQSLTDLKFEISTKEKSLTEKANEAIEKLTSQITINDGLTSSLKEKDVIIADMTSKLTVMDSMKIELKEKNDALAAFNSGANGDLGSTQNESEDLKREIQDLRCKLKAAEMTATPDKDNKSEVDFMKSIIADQLKKIASLEDALKNTTTRDILKKPDDIVVKTDNVIVQEKSPEAPVPEAQECVTPLGRRNMRIWCHEFIYTWFINIRSGKFSVDNVAILQESVFETASSQTRATTLSCEGSGISATVVTTSEELQQSPATTTTSTISTADLSFLQPLHSTRIQLEKKKDVDAKQLTHISATSSGVALPNVLGLMPQDQSQGMSRLERIGRATLRKTQAIEDDDHLTSVTSQSSTESTLNSLTVPNHNLPVSHGNSFEDDDGYGKTVLSNLPLGSGGHFPGQPPMAAPIPLSLSNINPLGEAALQLFMHQRQIKQETFAPTENLLNWAKSSDLLANQLLSLTHGPLTGLSFPNLVQSHSVDLTPNTDEYRAAAAAAVSSVSSTQNHSITDRKPHSFDMAKFAESRNVHSTESTASTSSEPPFRGSDVPRKSVIQDDIRMGKGRFRLVKKRGRSDVWNLFGQVMDNVTGQRLPFVACYACKVLYTDTGGGTGNMTRHRCPLGASYRSITGSSTDTINDSFNAQSSFESYHGQSPDNGKISILRMPSTSNTNIQLVFSWEHFSSSFFIIDRVRSSWLVVVWKSIPRCPLNSGTCFSHCAIIGESTGKPSFTKLLEETFQTAQRLFPSHHHNADYKSFAELLPKEHTVTKFIKEQSNVVRDKLRAHFQASQKSGIVLICQELRYAERQMMTIWASFIDDSWEYQRICLTVKENATNLETLLAEVANKYGFGDASQIFVTLDDNTNPKNRPTLLPNMKYVENVVFAINEILITSINESVNICEISKIAIAYQIAMNSVSELEFSNNGPTKGIVPFHGNVVDDKTGNILNALNLYRLLKQVRLRLDLLKQHLLERRLNDIVEGLEATDKNVAHSLESFLEPFYEVAQTFDSDEDPHFHTILPEWHALIHECASVDEESESQDSKDHPMNLSDRPRRRSLRHQKSIDDEPIVQIDDTDDFNLAPACKNKDTWMKDLRRNVGDRLKTWAREHISPEHRIATALNPIMRKLPIICSDAERLATYSQIRKFAGLKRVSESKNDQGDDYEPQRKRQNFLSKLEDQGMAQDEFDNYLNIQLAPQEGRSVMEFWSKTQNLPNLVQYSKVILQLVAAASPLQLRYVANHFLTDADFADMLILKTSMTFGDTHSEAPRLKPEQQN
ncbi:hypothetical protein FO519_001684 [Halicephalobus sp. NKZ332]|nr:hypothetical protein FO519_001684 [Halicephalobus sp. NKZ332]